MDVPITTLAVDSQDSFSTDGAFKAKQRLFSSLLGTSANILLMKRLFGVGMKSSGESADRDFNVGLNIDDATVKNIAGILSLLSKDDPEDVHAARYWHDFAEGINFQMEKEQQGRPQEQQSTLYRPKQFSERLNGLYDADTREDVSKYLKCIDKFAFQVSNTFILTQIRSFSFQNIFWDWKDVGLSR